MYYRSIRAKTEANVNKKQKNPFAFSLKKEGKSQKLIIQNCLINPQIKNKIKLHTKCFSNFQEPHVIVMIPKKQIKDINYSKMKTQIQSQVRQKYQIQNIIGKGSFGEVYTARNTNEEKMVAIKKIIQDRKLKNRQLRILNKLNHVNIIKILDYYTKIENHRPFIFIVMPLYSCDLYSVIHKKRLHDDLMRIYIYQILKGLNYLQEQRVAHRDLKPHNILIDKNTHKLVIADFGSAKIIDKGQSNLNQVGARSYRAPELVYGSVNYDCSVDMWALGCIIAEMINGNPLFRVHNTVQHTLQIIKMIGSPCFEQVLSMNSEFSMKQFVKLPQIKKKPLSDKLLTSDEPIIDLLSKMFVYSPRNRITPAKALEHPYFHCLQRCQYLTQFEMKFGKIPFHIIEEPKHIKLTPAHKRNISKFSSNTKSQFETLETNYSQLRTQYSSIETENFPIFQTATKRKLF